MLRNEYENIDAIVVGSSHGDFGFNPIFYPKSFNLCCRSQDLKHSFYLYKNIAEKYSGIKKLILFYSVFSPGSFLEKSPSESEICLAINELFNLNIEYIDEKLKVISKEIKGKLDQFSIEIEGMSGFMPNAGKGFFSSEYGAKNRAFDHMKYNNIDEANIYLEQTILLAKQLGHKVCIVIPPVRSDYRAACEADTAYLFRSLFDSLKNIEYDVDVANFFDDSRFSDDDFGDYDHLLPLGKGVETLTRAVYDLTNPSAATKN